MGRRTKPSAAAKDGPTARDWGWPDPDAQADTRNGRHGSDLPRPNPGFLVLTVLLQIVWIAFLLVTALSG